MEAGAGVGNMQEIMVLFRRLKYDERREENSSLCYWCFSLSLLLPMLQRQSLIQILLRVPEWVTEDEYSYHTSSKLTLLPVLVRKTSLLKRLVGVCWGELLKASWIIMYRAALNYFQTTSQNKGKSPSTLKSVISHDLRICFKASKQLSHFNSC